MESAGIARRPALVDRAAKPVWRPDPRRRRGRLRRDRQAINLGSPKQLQVVLFDNWACRSQTHQTSHRLTDAAVCSTRPGIVSATSVLTSRLKGHRRRVAPERWPPTTHPHRFNQTSPRPAGSLDQTQPAEHPDPHRRGPADPGRVRGRGQLRQLMAADYTARSRCGSPGAPCPDRRRELTGGPAFVRRVPGVRRAHRRGHRRAAAPGQRRCPYGLAYGLAPTAVAAVENLHEANEQMDAYLPDSAGGARLPARVVEAGLRTATSTVLGRHAATCRAGRGNRQVREAAEAEAALNAVRAARPTSRVAMIQVDNKALNRYSWRRACCCRSTTSCCSKSPR